MSNQIVISSGAKVRELEGVLTGTAGIVNALGINVPSGIPQLDGSGKILVSQLPNSVMEYKGSWNAATNTPTLVNGTGNAGDVYLCEVAGTVNFGAGPITFAVGDQVIYSGSIWQRASGATGTVTSVAVTESGDALTITGSPITTSGTINIGFAGTSGQYINGAGGLTTFPSLTGFVPYTGATANVDLGIYGLLSSGLISKQGLIIEGDGINDGGNLQFKQYPSVTIGTIGYTTLSANDSTSFNISFNQPSSSDYKNVKLSSSLLTNNIIRTYSFPDLSGTLALLEGSQTFTGLKTFSNNVNINQQLFINGGTGYGGGVSYRQGGILSTSDGSTTTEFPDANSIKYYVGQGSNTYKNFIFDVNGITLGATRTYTLPDASGTLALTSNLSSYVPYSGATNNVDLGSNHITSATIVFWKGTGSGLGNIGIGRIVPLGQNTTGQVNIGIGENALFYNTTGSNNIALGGSANGSNTTGSSNIGIGSSTNYANTTSSNNIAIGLGALSNNTIDNNIAIGHLSSYFNTTGNQNVSLGYTALYTNTTGSINTAIGHSTLYSNTTGSQNTALGGGALFFNTTGSNNTGIGNLALQQNTTGVNNTAIGSFSSYLNTTGQNNTSVGTSSLRNNTTGESNTAIGSTTLNNNTTGINNTGIGFAVLSNSTTASNNVAIGYASGVNISTGSNNTLVTGGSAITTGSNNTIIGNYAGTTTLANNIVLADGAGNIRYQWNGTNNVFGNPISGTTASFASSGGSDTFAINHSSGSGIALNITKGGNGEGLVINKTSGSGNALTVIGSTSLGALSGTSATFSGSVTADGQLKTTATGQSISINAASTGSVRMQLQNTSGNAGVTVESSTGGDQFSGTSAYSMAIGTYTARDLFLGTNSVQRFKLDASTGAATFSSSVAVGGGNNSGATFAINNGGAEAKQTFAGFSSNVNLTQSYNNSGAVYVTDEYRAASYIFKIGTTTAMTLSDSGNTTLTLGVSGEIPTIKAGGGNTDLQIEAVGTGGFLDFVTNGSSKLRILPSGVSNFTSSVSVGDSVGLLGELYWGGFSSGQKVRAYPTGSSGSATLNYSFWNGSAWAIQATLTSAGVWSSNGGGTSDLRTKDEIDYNFDNGIESILKLQPTKFKFKISPNKQRRGFIAQDVLEVIPDLVLGDGEKEDGTYGLDYDGILALAVKAIQEQQAQIEELKAMMSAKN